MSLNPCACGTAGIPGHNALYDVDGQFLQRHHGLWASCGQPRDFLFRLPEQPLGGSQFGDASSVPASAFFSPRGLEIRSREPGRFRRARLEVVRDTYRTLVAELTDAPKA